MGEPAPEAKSGPPDRGVAYNCVGRMDFKDTAIGGDRRQFPTTIWTQILEAADPASPDNRHQLERLLGLYWKPVYLHIRMKWKKSSEDAKDLTQAFFGHMLEKEFLSKLKPGLGTFRSYLKASVSNYVVSAERAAAVRRPDGPVFSIEAGPGELDRLGPESPDETADEAYDREWFDCLFDDALRDLQATLHREDKDLYFESFRLYCLEPLEVTPRTRGPEDAEPPPPTYKEVAARLKLRESDVRNYLAYARRLLQDLLRARIREYALTDEEVEHEIALALRS